MRRFDCAYALFFPKRLCWMMRKRCSSYDWNVRIGKAFTCLRLLNEQEEKKRN